MDNPNDNRETILALKKLAETLTSEGKEDLAIKALKIARGISDRTTVGNLPPSNILQDLNNLLKDCGIKFAVIGGLAVCARGQLRSTEDIDVLVSKLPSSDKLRDSGYMAKFNFYKGKSSTGTVLTLDHRSSAGYVEMLVATDEAAKWASGTASNENVLKVLLPVVSAEALVVLKLKAGVGNKKRQGKDFPDILSVLSKNKINFEEVVKFLNSEEKEVLKKLVSVLSKSITHD